MEIVVHACLYGLVAGAAWTYGRESPPHRVIAYLFGWELVADMLRLLIGPELDQASVPYRDGILVLYYFDHALVASFRFAVLAACLRVFTQTPARYAAYAFAATVAGLVILKQATNTSLVPVHAAIAAITTAASSALAIRAVLAPAERLQSPNGAHLVLLAILALLLAKVCLHYFGPVEDTWAEVLVSDTFVHGLIAIGYVGALVRVGVRRWRAS